MEYVVIGTIVWGVAWGILVNKVIENKGYQENWFWWGFFFGFFALIVALTKQSIDEAKPSTENASKVEKAYVEMVSSESLTDKLDIYSPVHITSWQIKKDEDDNLMLFVDFLNVTESKISSVMFSVVGYNSFGDKVYVNDKNSFDIIEQDLAINASEYGITQTLLPNMNIRKVDIKVKKVRFANETIFENDASKWIDMNQKPLNSIHLDCAKTKNSQAKFYSTLESEYWQCVCGFVNIRNECSFCAMPKADALEFTKDNIHDTYQKYLKELEIKRQVEEDRQKKEKRKVKRSKNVAIITSSIVALAITITAFFNYIIIPNRKYNQATEYLNNGEFGKSAMLYGSLNDYKDSSEKSVFCWNKILDRNTISSTRFLSIGLKENGTVIGTGYNFYGCDVSNWNNIITLAAGFEHAVGLKTNLTVVTTGNNEDGACDVSEWKNIIDISTKDNHTVGLKMDGTVVAVGYNEFGQCNVSEWKDIVAISAGASHTVGLKADGTVVAVGYNENGECNVSEWKDIVAISAGGMHTVGLKADGTVIAVGCNDYGACDVSEWKDIIAVSADGVTVGLKKDGTVVAVGPNDYGACNVSEWKDITAICTSDHHTIGVQSNGSIAFTGYNEYEIGNISEWRDIKVPNNE